MYVALRMMLLRQSEVYAIIHLNESSVKGVKQMQLSAMPTQVIPLNASVEQRASCAYLAQLCNPDTAGCPGWGPTFLWISANKYLAVLYPHVPEDMTVELYSATAQEFNVMTAAVAEWLSRHCSRGVLASGPRIIGISPVIADCEMPMGLSTIAL